MGKLYSVTVTVEIDMPVYAKNEVEAEEIAIDNWEDEYDHKISASAREITEVSQLPKAFRGAMPWNGNDDDTCEKYLASNGSV